MKLNLDFYNIDWSCRLEGASSHHPTSSSASFKHWAIIINQTLYSDQDPHLPPYMCWCRWPGAATIGGPFVPVSPLCLATICNRAGLWLIGTYWDNAVTADISVYRDTGHTPLSGRQGEGAALSSVNSCRQLLSIRGCQKFPLVSSYHEHLLCMWYM